jgi:hypothetical protein
VNVEDPTCSRHDLDRADGVLPLLEDARRQTGGVRPRSSGNAVLDANVRALGHPRHSLTRACAPKRRGPPRRAADHTARSSTDTRRHRSSEEPSRREADTHGCRAATSRRPHRGRKAPESSRIRWQAGRIEYQSSSAPCGITFRLPPILPWPRATNKLSIQDTARSSASFTRLSASSLCSRRTAV